jgi:hypothetical protein
MLEGILPDHSEGRQHDDSGSGDHKQERRTHGEALQCDHSLLSVQP